VVCCISGNLQRDQVQNREEHMKSPSDQMCVSNDDKVEGTFDLIVKSYTPLLSRTISR